MTQRNPKEKDSHWLGRPRFICLLLAFLTLVLFWPVHSFEFLNYDDTAYATSNRHVLTGLTPENIRWAFLTLDTGNWHPLTWLSHMLDTNVFGPSPAGPHVVNLLLHVLNTVLVFLLLHGLTQARWRSAWSPRCSPGIRFTWNPSPGSPKERTCSAPFLACSACWPLRAMRARVEGRESRVECRVMRQSPLPRPSTLDLRLPHRPSPTACPSCASDWV